MFLSHSHLAFISFLQHMFSFKYHFSTICWHFEVDHFFGTQNALIPKKLASNLALMNRISLSVVSETSILPSPSYPSPWSPPAQVSK